MIFAGGAAAAAKRRRELERQGLEEVAPPPGKPISPKEKKRLSLSMRIGFALTFLGWLPAMYFSISENAAPSAFERIFSSVAMSLLFTPLFFPVPILVSILVEEFLNTVSPLPREDRS